MTRSKPQLSVVVCTHNPRGDLIAKALRALSVQTLNTKRFEIVVIDNNSQPPLRLEYLEYLTLTGVNLVVEKRQGLVYARVAGIQSSKADVLVFVDDDNELHPDYLEQVLKIADAEPGLGVFGGRCLGVLEKKVDRLRGHFLPHLGVRDKGLDALTGSGAEWGPHEPIGAGIVIRRPIAEIYAKLVDTQPLIGRLGRSGNVLMSGEDSFISRIASRLGFECGYRPQLCLKHFITKRRLSYGYLRRLMTGHGYSYVLLETIMGRNPGELPRSERKMIAAHFLHRVKTKGIAEAMGMVYWDIGYLRALKERGGWAKPADLLSGIDKVSDVRGAENVSIER